MPFTDEFAIIWFNKMMDVIELKKRLFACLLMIAMLLTGCTGKENEKPHVASYENGQKLLAEGKYEEAALIFESLNGYEDSVLLLVYARAKDKLSKGDYQSAINGFLSIEGYRDSALAARYAGARMLSESEDGYSIVEGAEIFDGMLLYLDSADRALTAREDLYRRANAYMDAGEYVNAREDYTALGEYRDSASMEKYAYAKIFEAAGIENPMGYLRAVDAFEEVYDFKDSAERARSVLENVYKEAERLVGSGKPDEAETLFRLLAYPKTSGWTNRNRFAYLDSEKMIDYCQVLSLSASVKPKDQVYAAYRFESMGDFRDASKRAEELRKKVYDEGFNQLNAGEFQKAKEIFLLQDYEDSQMMGSYAVAAGLEKSAENEYARYADAAEAFEALGEFKDSAKRAADSRERLYTLATEALEGGLYYDAKYYFNLQADYRDSADLSRYAAITADYQASGNDAQALLNVKERYIALGDVKDSQNMVAAINEEVYLMAQNALLKNAFNRAETLFEMLSGYKDSGEMVLYTQAAREENAGSVHSLMKAAEMYENMNGFSDSAQKAQEIRSRVYQEAKASLENYDFDRAIEYFGIQDYEDSGEYASYARAMKKEFSSSYRDHISAAEAFEAMNGFKDSAERAEAIRENVYKMAVTALEYRNFKNAVRLFELQDYKDSKDMIAYTRTMEMEFSSNVEDQISAAEKYEAMNGFKDSAERAKAIRENVYNTAMNLLENGNFQNAVRLFGMQDYKDSKDMIAYANTMEKELVYGIDKQILVAEEYEAMNGFKDSAERAKAIRENVYNTAMDALENLDYDNAVMLFALQDYKDSEKMIAYTKAREKELSSVVDMQILAAEEYEAMDGFRDSAEKAEAIRETVYNMAMTALENRNFKYAVQLFNLQNYKDSKDMIGYTEAMKLEFSSSMDVQISAAEAYEAMRDFRDSAERAKAIREKVYSMAMGSLGNHDYDKAVTLFSLQDYKDSKDMIAYAKASEMEHKGEKINAVDAFLCMGDFRDASARAEGILSGMLAEAKAYEDKHEYDLASEVYASMGEHKDGTSKSKYVLSEKELYEAGDDPAKRILAAASFENLGGILDSAERVKEIRDSVYENALTALEEGMYEDAEYLFSLQDYKDSQKLSAYSGALKLEFAPKGDDQSKIKAAISFEQIPDVKDSRSRAEAIRKDLCDRAHEKLEAGQYADARKLFMLQPEYDRNRIFADYAEARELEAQAQKNPVKWISANEVYVNKLQGQLDADERAANCLASAYEKAWALYEDADYDQAIKVFKLLKDYEDSENAGKYVLAEKTLNTAKDNAKMYVEAKEMYTALGNYKDAQVAAETIDKQLFVRFVDYIGVFTKDGLARFEKNGKWGYLSIDGKVLVNAKYDMAYDFSEGLAAVKLGDKWGYIDTQGNVIISMKYEKARSFSDGMAAIVQDGFCSYITRSDVKIKLPFNIRSYNFDTLGDFKSGYASVDGKVIEVNGKTVSQYAPISVSEGIAVVRSDYSTYRYMTDSGEYLSDMKWSYAWPFENGRGIVMHNNKCGIIDKNGKIVSNLQWDEIQSAVEDVFLVKKGGYYGYIDKDGNTVSDVQWNYAYPYSDGLALVWQNGYYGYIDKNGNTAIDFVFDEAKSFEDGVAFVKQYGAWKCIDTKGKTVFEIDERVNTIYGSAKEERIRVSGGDGKYGYIDQNGKIVIQMKYKDAQDFSEGRAAVKENYYWSYIRENGSKGFNGEFRAASAFANGYALVEDNSYSNEFLLIDLYGKTLFSSNSKIVRVSGDRFCVYDVDNYQYKIIDHTQKTYSFMKLENVTVDNRITDGKVEFISAINYVYTDYGSGRSETQTVPIDENGRVLPRSGVDETGVFAVKQNGVWYFTDKDGEIIF